MALFYPSERYRVALLTKVGGSLPRRISEAEEIVFNTKHGGKNAGGRRRSEEISYYQANSGSPTSSDKKWSDSRLRFCDTQDTNITTKRTDQASRVFDNEGTYA